MTLERFETPADGPRLAARALERLLRHANGPVLLLCSGGSALAMLDAFECPPGLAAALTIGPLDERITDDPQLRNADRLRNTRFARTAMQGGAAFLEADPQRFAEALSAWRQEHRDGRILATLGIGADGHIAGIAAMPDDPQAFAALFEREENAIEYETRRLQPPRRLTATLPFLRALDGAVAYAAREKPVARALESGPLHACPARVLRELRELTLVTDSPDA